MYTMKSLTDANIHYTFLIKPDNNHMSDLLTNDYTLTHIVDIKSHKLNTSANRNETRILKNNQIFIIAF